MKLLFSSSFFPSSEDDNIPQFLLEQVKALSKYYPEIEILIVTTSREKTLEQDKLPSNVKVKRFSYLPSTRLQSLTNIGIMPAISKNKFNALALPLLFISEYLALKKAIKEFEPNYIYSHWFLPQGLINYYLSKKFKTPQLFTSHSYDVEITKKIPYFGTKIAKKAISNIHKGTAVSKQTLSSIEKLFTKDEWLDISNKFIVLPMGINKPQKNKTIKKITNLLFMGRFVDKKGITYLLEAIEILKHQYPDILLNIAGDGPLNETIKKEIENRKIKKNVVMVGFITKEKKETLINQTSIYILPSIISKNGDREGLPVSLIENMAAGNICIATHCSGANEIIRNGINGYLCEPNNSMDIADKIRNVIEGKTDNNEIRREAINSAQDLQWKHIIKRQYDHFFITPNHGNETPLVSVIMPVYNAEKYLEKSILSIQQQTYPNIELLIIDDKSTDNSLKIINELIDKKTKTYKNIQNIGYLKSCNFLFEKCKGSLITFQDADDWSDPKRIEEQVSAFNNDKNLNLCGTQCEYHKKNKTYTSKFPLTHEEILKTLEKGETSIFCGASVMFKKEILLTYGKYREFYNRIGAEDLDYFWRVITTEKMINLPKKYYNYRSNENSVTQLNLTNPLQHYSTQLAFLAHKQRKNYNIDFTSTINTEKKVKDFFTKKSNIKGHKLTKKIVYNQLAHWNINGYIKSIKVIHKKTGVSFLLFTATTAFIPFFILNFFTPKNIIRALVRRKNNKFIKKHIQLEAFRNE